MSEYTQRYQHVSHKELYDAVVQAGDPQQVDTLASQWSSLKDTLDGLARDLDADLDKLSHTWSGDAAREFGDRLALVVRFSGELAEGTAQVRQALSDMAGALRTAQRDAESPEETDDNDKMISNAAKGGALFGLGGAFVGGFIGHQQDKAEQEKAHQRMVQVVADLAAGYEVSAYGRVVEAPAPDPRLPGGADPASSTAQAGPASSTPSAAPTTGLAGRRGGASADTPGGVSPGPTGGSGSPGAGTVGAGVGGGGVPVTAGTGTGTGTQLAGADALLGGALVGGSTVGLAGLAGASPTTGTPGVGPGLAFGAPGAVPAGGLVNGTGALASSGRSAPVGSARPGTGAPGMENRSAAGTGRLAAGQTSGNSGAGRPGTGGTPAHRSAAAPGANSRNGVLGGRGQQGEDDNDERLTWLTEDEMVWHDGDSGAPSVLGGS